MSDDECFDEVLKFCEMMMWVRDTSVGVNLLTTYDEFVQTFVLERNEFG